MPESTVTLGDRDHLLVPQGIGRIRRKVNQIFKALNGDLEVTEMTEELYDVFKVFIPDIAPLWQQLGFVSEDVYDQARAHAEAKRKAQEAHVEALAVWEKEWQLPNEIDGEVITKDGAPDPPEPEPADPFDEPEPGPDAPRTPTIPQIEDALDAIYKVNGGERLVRLLGKVISPELLRAKISTEIMNFNSGGSTNSRRVSGALTSTTSTTTAPTSAESADSPSPGSSTSSTPTEPEPVAN